MHTRLTYLVRESRKALLTQTLTSSTVLRRVAVALADEAWGGKSRRQDITYHSFEMSFASASLLAMTLLSQTRAGGGSRIFYKTP